MRRILMNAADPDTTGSGGGAVVPPAAAPAPSAPPSPPSVETLLAAMDDPKLRDSFFAEMRRSGRIKGAAKPAGTETTTETAPAPKAVETEMVSRADLVRERAFTRSIAIHGQGLTDRQIARMERSFETEKPSADAVGEWVAGYISDLGLKSTVAATTVTPPISQPQSPPAAPAPTPAPAQPPVTNVGTPAAPSSPLENRNLLKLTAPETAELMKQHGVSKVRQLLREQMSKTGFRTK